ncbi:sterol desaturase family protein [Echinicola jeungdonensis]|uniref:Sterol desaturase family protein n=1 Tax=Echinicola jeungdonensis TaxID=709343 RepID=A0ABV5J8A0_9BACT|nr:sterol desaturase family protein [Echinicola jeungdonensis]MDN3669241.1 sterol desaturase family protein [Echinicola jeungdonensis]
MVINIIFTLLGFLLMELAGWAIHKYLMHGILWKIHKTHHKPSRSFLESNDVFSLVFGGVSILLMWLGHGNFDFRFWIGIGISIYGFSYFVLHDLLIHKRVKGMKMPKNSILRGIYKAHQAHHSHNKKNGAVAFGLFLVPFKYFKTDKS